jgi:hypothetical protein
MQFAGTLFGRIVLIASMFVTAVAAGKQEWVRVADDGQGFVLAESGTPFTPWGFNYDHDERGRLIEDYWAEEWAKVEADFCEMKTLGANVVRVHLQLGKFMDAADASNEQNLDRLERLVKLAESQELYLDLTGLGCYHKADVPAWYDELDEQARWRVQARFWGAVAKRCAASPAVFCYDLMNEPVVPGNGPQRTDWLGPAFAGKHFVQFIARQTNDRPRHEIAREWIGQLRAAIRAHDERHLITVGLVPWSLDRPGLTSGFVPDKIAGELDFLAVHIYPESGKVDEALDTLKGFSVGKPIVIEELFPLKCSADELGEFIDKSRRHASGWIGFYWGKPPEEYAKSEEIGAAITLSWLKLFEARSAAARKSTAPGD